MLAKLFAMVGGLIAGGFLFFQFAQLSPYSAPWGMLWYEGALFLTGLGLAWFFSEAWLTATLSTCVAAFLVACIQIHFALAQGKAGNIWPIGLIITFAMGFPAPFFGGIVGYQLSRTRVSSSLCVLPLVCGLGIGISLPFAGQAADQRRLAEAEWSKHLVHAEQLQFMDLHLGANDYPFSRRLVGRLKNNSTYTVFLVGAKFRLLDCDEQSHCSVVAETQGWPVYQSNPIPPGQVQNIDTGIYFGKGTDVDGRLQWDYEVTEIRACPAT